MGNAYKNFVRPILFKYPAEVAHEHGITALKVIQGIPGLISCLEKLSLKQYERPIKLFGLDFPNPIGLAAGMDKNGEIAKSLSALGFGFGEVGTVTPKPQPGNDIPRLFRYPKEEAIINRMGFNNKGADAMARSLAKGYPKPKRKIPIGVNLGVNKTTPMDKAVNDYKKGLITLAPQADFITVNISSPNTRGLRSLQEAARCRILMAELQATNKEIAEEKGLHPLPLLIKIAPDLSFADLEMIAGLVSEIGFAGIVATNTTISRPQNWQYEEEIGGLSGKPLFEKSLSAVRYLSKISSGKIPIIGVGGINNEITLAKMMDAGASLIQIYTSFVYEGPFFPKHLAKCAVARYRF